MCPINDTITFPSINVSQVLQPHEDALVLILGINEFNMRRILVDSGSLADLLQMLAYKQMGYSPFALESPGRLLSEFNGAMTTSQGDVMLPFQAGPVILNVQFLMVEDLSPFNAIVGLAWLHRMKVVHSMYH